MDSSTVEQNTKSQVRETLAEPIRREIAEAAARAVEQKIWDPQFDRERWRDTVRSNWDRIMTATDAAAFEGELNELVQRANGCVQVPSADIGFFHESSRKRPMPKGLAARFRYCEPNECSPAYTATFETADVLYSRLGDGIGWLKVTKFPGAIGIDTANQIDLAVAELKRAGCDRLILDLRGNTSGGLAFLRLMSYLTPGRLVGGYSITRVGAEKGTPKERLKKFDWVPSQKWALPWLVLKYGLGDPSVSIVTEGIGPQPFHRRTAVLVDEQTTGAGERVAAFAAENHLATVVGTRTPGKLICSDSVKLGHQYLARIPARVWYTGQGRLLEGIGVQPEIELKREVVGADLDNQLQETVNLVRSI